MQSRPAFVSGAALSKAIRAVMAEGPCDLAVAFWGAGAANLLGLPEQASGYRIACDAFSGACNPKTIKDLLNRGTSVVNVGGIHAKVYVGSSSMVVCSANASANGLGEEDSELDPALEAGVLLYSSDAIGVARAWFQGLFDGGTTLTSNDLKKITALWKARRLKRPTRRRMFRLIDVVLNDPSWFEGRGLRVVVYDGAEPPASVIATYKASPYHVKDPKREADDWPFYWSTGDWKVDAGELILDFEVDGDKVECSGVWQVEGKIANGNITAVRLAHRPLGLSFPERDWRRLAKEVEKAIVAKPLPRGELIDVGEISHALKQG